MEVVVITGAISRAKLQSDHHHQQTNIQLFTGRMSFLSSNPQCHSMLESHAVKYPYPQPGPMNSPIPPNSSGLSPSPASPQNFTHIPIPHKFIHPCRCQTALLRRITCHRLRPHCALCRRNGFLNGNRTCIIAWICSVEAALHWMGPVWAPGCKNRPTPYPGRMS